MYTTARLFAPFTPARRTRKTGAVQFNWVGASRPNGQRIDAMPALQARISKNLANLDVFAELKARGRDALQVVLRSKSDQADPDARLMPRGAERC